LTFTKLKSATGTIEQFNVHGSIRFNLQDVFKLDLVFTTIFRVDGDFFIHHTDDFTGDAVAIIQIDHIC
jgi:hypothetical protein